MASDVTVIGRGTRVRGRVSGAVSLEIQGHVEGDVTVDGDVTIDTHGTVGANVSGRRVVIRGAVKGDITGVDAVVLEDGARVVGDLRAPRIGVGPGALVRGFVETGNSGGAPRARANAAPAVRALPRPAPVAHSVVQKAAPEPVKVAPPAARHVAPVALAGGAPPAAKPAPVRQGPPPPVVPALKKGAKGVLKKKA
jgi:cytoskeletal protein CcmA (bactofilin family)